MRLVRPHIPLDVRLIVIRRQLIAHYGSNIFRTTINKSADVICHNKKHRLKFLLGGLFGTERIHLDHDPPLMNRTKIFKDGKHTGYIPAANDPEYLIYRTKPDHKIKTFVRGDGALRSDVSQRRYLNRVAANRNPKKKFKPRRAKHIRRMTHASIPVRHD